MERMKDFKIFRSLILSLMLLMGMIVVTGCGKKEEYRQIQVYKIDGKATVGRQGSSMEAYENMQLQSGDIIETIKDSYLQLKLDEDKYILVEPESKISLQASGNSVDSKTGIYLEKGAIVNQIDNPLSEDSSYEVTTPNSTMAVRGTTFRVELTLDENGESHAKVAVYGGKVECNLVFPDGTITDPVLVEPGIEVLIWGDDVESEYVMTGKANYDDLKIKVIDFLGVIIDRGEELSITKEEIEELKEGLAELEETESTEEVTEDEIEEEDVEEVIEEETSESKTTETTIEETEEEPTEEEEKKEETSTSTGGTSSDDSSAGGSSGGGTSAPTTPKRNVIIEFINDGVFATKTVQINATATSFSVTAPKLQPPQTAGCWQFEAEQNVGLELDAASKNEIYASDTVKINIITETGEGTDTEGGTETGDGTDTEGGTETESGSATSDIKVMFCWNAKEA